MVLISSYIIGDDQSMLLSENPVMDSALNSTDSAILQTTGTAQDTLAITTTSELNLPVTGTQSNSAHVPESPKDWIVILQGNVTVHKEDIILEELLQAIAERSKVVFEIIGKVDLTQKINVAFDQAFLKDSIDSILSAGNYQFSITGENDRLEITIYGEGDASQIRMIGKKIQQPQETTSPLTVNPEISVPENFNPNNVSADQIVRNYDLLTTGQSAERAAASKELQVLGQEVIGAKLREYISTVPDESERVKATRALFYSDTLETYQFLGKLLQDPNKEVVKEAAVLIEDSEEDTVIPDVIQAIKTHKEEEIVLSLIDALSGIGGRETEEGFLQAMKHESAKVRKESADLVVYESHSKLVLESLKNLAKNDPDSKVRAQALYSLRVFPKPDYADILTYAAKNESDGQVQDLAKKMMEKLSGSEDDLDDFEDEVDIDKDEDDEDDED